MDHHRVRRLLAAVSGLLVLSGVLAGGGLPAEAASAPRQMHRMESATLTRSESPGLAAHRPDEVIVKFRSLARAADVSSVRSRFGLSTVKRSRRTGAELVKVGQGQTVAAVIQELRGRGLVEYAQPNYIYYPRDLGTNDTDKNDLWGLDNPTGIDMDVPEGWAAAGSTQAVTVAVIDTGVDISHPDLAGKIWVNQAEQNGAAGIDDDGNGYIDDINGWDFLNRDNSVFDPFQGDEHGTHVAGTIAAAINNGLGVAGVATNVKIMPLKFLGPWGGDTMAAVEAVDYAAAMGARVINASWGGTFTGQADDLALQDAINRASGLVFVAAAGNDGRDNDAVPESPASLAAPNILSVAAVDSGGNLAGFSNFGATSVDLGAPGVNVRSTFPKVPDGGGAGVLVEAAGYKSLFLGFGMAGLDQWTDIATLTEKSLSALGLTPANSVLLVDDDGYPDTSLWDSLLYYQLPLEDLGYTPVIYEVPQDAEGPSAATLEQYDAVIWFTGYDFGSGGNGPIQPADQANLIAYLNTGGKRLLLSGFDASNALQYTPLLQDYLKVRVENESGRNGSLRGATGTAFDGTTINLFPGDPAVDWRDVLTLPAGAGAAAHLALVYNGDSVYDGDEYQFLNGTSMAAPHVSGVAAMVMGQKNLTPAETVALLMGSGRELPSLQGTTVSGRMVNLYNAVATAVTGVSAAAGGAIPGQADTYTISFSTSGYGKLVPGNTVTITFPAGTTLPAEIPAGSVTIGGVANGAAVTPSGETVTLTVPSTVAHGGTVSIAFAEAAGIRNPGEGQHVLTVATSADTTPVTATYQIAASMGLGAADYHGVGTEGGTYRKAAVTVASGVLNANLTGVDTVAARVTSATDGTGIGVTLTETGPDTGVFSGTFGFTEAAVSDDAGDLIRVAAGGSETITVSVNDGTVNRTATATWSAAEKRHLISGQVAPTSPALATVNLTLINVTQGRVETTMPLTPDGTTGYAYWGFDLPISDTDTYQVIAHAPGYVAESAPISLALPSATVETAFFGTWADRHVVTVPDQVLTADATPPAAPVLTAPVAQTYSTPTISVTGSADPFSTAKVLLDEQVAYAVTTDSTGAFTYSLGSVSDGAHTVKAVAADWAGNEASTSVSITVDATKPAPPAVDPIRDTDTAVTGTAEAGSTVTVKAGATALGTGTAGGDGRFTVTIAPQVLGTALAVTATDAASNESDVTPITVSDGTPPARPTANPVDDNDTTVTGSAEAGAAVTVKVGATVLGTAQAEAGGAYTAAIPAQAAGTVLSVTAADADHNVSEAATVTVTDATPPAAPAVDPVDNLSTGVTGAAEVGATLRVMVGLTELGTATAGADGRFTVTIAAQPAGTSLTVTAADAAGNVSTATNVVVGERDVTPPAAPTINPVSDNATAVSGTAEAGATVTVMAGVTTLGSGVATGGNFSIAIAAQTGGTVLTVTATDGAGNVSAPATVTVTATAVPAPAPPPAPPADRTPPPPPVLNPVDDNDTVVTGTAEEGSTVTLFRDGVVIGSATATGGRFSIPIPVQKGGTLLSATATDRAGNMSDLVGVTVADLTPPPAPTVGAVSDRDTLVTGSAEPGTTVTVTNGAKTVAEGMAAANGAFSLSMAPQKAGSILIVTVRDRAGNAAQARTTVLDRTAPAVGAIDSINADDTTVTGTTEPGATVTVLRGAAQLGTAAAGPDGRFSVTIPKQSAATLLTVKATDAAGNTSEPGQAEVHPSGVASAPSVVGQRTVTISDSGKAALTETVDPGRVKQGGPLVIDLQQGQASIGRKDSARTGTVTEAGATVPAGVMTGLAESGQYLEVRSAFATVTMPGSAVAPALATAGEKATLTVSVSAEPMGDFAVVALEEGGFRPRGPVLSLTAAITGSDGKRTELHQFAGRVTVRIPFTAAENPEQLFVYRRNPVTGAWEFRGGRVDMATMTIEVELDGFSDYTVLEYNGSFTDVPADHPDRAEIQWMAARGLVKGVRASLFDPDGAVTRAQFAALLVRVLGLTAYDGTEQQFSDVRPADWFYRDVEAAARAGLIKGFAGHFRPDDPVSREEMAVMVTRAMALKGKPFTVTDHQRALWQGHYRDAEEIADWAWESIIAAGETGMTKPSFRFGPKVNASRAEVASVLQRLAVLLAGSQN